MPTVRRARAVAVILLIAGGGWSCGRTSSPTPVSSAPQPMGAPRASAVGPTYPTGNDLRNGLKAGYLDAGTAQSGMRLVSFTPKPVSALHGACRPPSPATLAAWRLFRQRPCT